MNFNVLITSFYGLGNRRWEELACHLIFLCRLFAQAQETSLVSTIWLRNVVIAADDALDTVADLDRIGGVIGVWSRTNDRAQEDRSLVEAADIKFRKALNLLSDFAKEFPLKDSTSDPNISGTVTGEEVKNGDNSKSPTTILHALKNNLLSNPMGYGMFPSERSRIVKFYILESLHDFDPFIVKLSVKDGMSCPEIVWGLRHSFNKKKRSALKENPHFYHANLPTLLKAHGRRVKIDPTEDFQQADTFYVLTDRRESVRIITGNKILHYFGNLWHYENTIIFKDICGRLMGESIVKASLRGTSGELCVARFPLSICVPRPLRTRNQCALQPIVTDFNELYPWTGWKRFIDSPPLFSSADSCLCVIKRPVPVPVPLPPTSEHPGYPVFRTHIHDLDNDSLLQIFTHCRLEHEENWNLRLRWRNLAQVCQRWRYFMFDLSPHLDICVSLTKYSPPIDKLSHLPPIPLIIDYSDRTGTMTLQDEDNIRVGLERHDRVRRVDIQAPSSSFHLWLLQMNQLFPRLVDLSLLSTTLETNEMNLVLPETLQAPHLRHLSLHGIGLPTGLLLLPSAIALSTLSLTHIRASCCLPPRHLITQLKGLPHLEELSIGFAIQIPFPGSEGELLPPPLLPVTLPALKRLTFRGEDAYLDNLVSQISTPILERLTLTLHFDLTFTLVYLTEFIYRTEDFRLLVSRVIFNKDGVSMDAGYNERQGGGESGLFVNVNCEPLDWQIDSATQVCSALGRVLSTVEDLTVDLRDFGMPSDWERTLEDGPWQELLLPFIGVKKLHIGSSLTLKLSQALTSGGGELVLPELQELEVSLKIDDVTNALTSFIESREFLGRHIDLLVPPEDEEEKIRIRTTLAARRSQRQELEYRWQRKLENAVDVERKVRDNYWRRKLENAVDAERKERDNHWRRKIDAERKEKEIWKARALALEELCEWGPGGSGGG